MKPEVGDIWKWYDGKHFLMLELLETLKGAYDLQLDKWWVLDLQSGSCRMMVVNPQHVTEKFWEKAA